MPLPYRIESLHLCFVADDRDHAERRLDELLDALDDCGFFFQCCAGPEAMSPSDVIPDSPLARALIGRGH